ncbi:zinc-binding dehydrogenase [Actinomarinicola tropica]|uniref:Zinc-binding dehydrogenase n=1 Tax=Actinomarinicola tropica TaxID=2789776 RepID=A0A5Q2RQP4_9ACTN|nr:zinc-binding dehydrogenase [Actinomarinicola tropica]QGG96881.1 zinc-binding dehydrogenase [Actinomarinicola tropica]
MRATVFHGPGDVRLETVPDPRLEDDRSVLVEVQHTAICGSDLHLYYGVHGAPGIHLGHEFVGTVVEAGAEVRRIGVGDQVLVSGVIGCGGCDACHAGDPVRCTGGGVRVFGNGLDLPGGQAELVAVPAADSACRVIPDGVTPEQAVMLTDILPTGWYGARRADITAGDTVAVIGLGPVGTFALQSALLLGAARVIAVDTVPERLDAAELLGAETVDAGAGTVAQVLEATGGRGVDAVIEAVGVDQTITDALYSCRPGGTVSVIGAHLGMEYPFPMGLAFLRDLTFRIGLCPVPSTWSELIPLVAADRIRPDDVITHRMGLSEVTEAYRLFDAREDGVRKILLDPTR